MPKTKGKSPDKMCQLILLYTRSNRNNDTNILYEYDLYDTWHPAQDNLTNGNIPPDNGNIGLTSRKSGGERITTRVAAPN